MRERKSEKVREIEKETERERERAREREQKRMGVCAQFKLLFIINVLLPALAGRAAWLLCFAVLSASKARLSYHHTPNPHMSVGENLAKAHRNR